MHQYLFSLYLFITCSLTCAIYCLLWLLKRVKNGVYIPIKAGSCLDMKYQLISRNWLQARNCVYFTYMRTFIFVNCGILPYSSILAGVLCTPYCHYHFRICLMYRFEYFVHLKSLSHYYAKKFYHSHLSPFFLSPWYCYYLKVKMEIFNTVCWIIQQ